MKILLITNDTNLMSNTSDSIDVINSIILVPEIANNYDYIVLDECNIILEGEMIGLLDPYIERVGVLGYNRYNSYTLLRRDEFSFDNIQLYFENNNKNTLKKGNSGEDNKETIYKLIKYIEKLTDINTPINETLKELNSFDKNFKKILYSYLPHCTKVRIFKNGSILNKLEVVKYIIREAITKKPTCF